MEDVNKQCMDANVEIKIKDLKTITTTWAMKQKANGDKQARVNACGFEQNIMIPMTSHHQW